MSLPQSKTDAQGHLRTLLCRSLSHLQLLRIPEGMKWVGEGGGERRGEERRGEERGEKEWREAERGRGEEKGGKEMRGDE